MDAGNMLKPMLARGELRMVGATTLDEFRKYIEKDPALERRFQQVRALAGTFVFEFDARIRDVTGTVENVSLITASILSKKLAAGLQALVMDVKVGNGAFCTTHDEALALANPQVQKFIEGQPIKKLIVVPGRLINIVV